MSYLLLPDGNKMDIFGSGGGEKLAKETGVPFLRSIPMDPQVRMGGDYGKPVILTAADSPVAKSLVRVSEEVAAKVSVAALMSENIVPITMFG